MARVIIAFLCQLGNSLDAARKLSLSLPLCIGPRGAMVKIDSSLPQAPGNRLSKTYVVHEAKDSFSGFPFPLTLLY